jgi:hypothetical protein
MALRFYAKLLILLAAASDGRSGQPPLPITTLAEKSYQAEAIFLFTSAPAPAMIRPVAQ